MNDDRVYSARTAVEVSGLPYRKLDYFVRTIRVSQQAAVGSGHSRRFTFTELVQFTALRHLLDLGVQHAAAWGVLNSNRGLDLTAPVSINIRWFDITLEVTKSLAKMDGLHPPAGEARESFVG